MIRIQEADFSVEEEVARLLRGHPEVGGIVTFVGTVRDCTGDRKVQAIELEHYPGMTERELERIESAARARFPVAALAVVHRVGRLAAGDNIVLVIAASRHRAAAFDACRFLIDHLKVQATFWKKEITSDGECHWVDACPGCEAAASGWDDLREVPHNHGPAGSAPAHPHPPLTPCAHGGVQEAPPHAHGHHHPQQARWGGLRVGILTLSDSRGPDNDLSGDALAGLVAAAGGVVAQREILPDDQAAIQARLIQWADRDGLDVILTSGGTGPGPRDVTPEATRAVCSREMPGFSELIRLEGLKKTRRAVLTRGVCAFRGATLVINLPGSTRGAVESFEAVADLVPHAVKMARGGGHG